MKEFLIVKNSEKDIEFKLTQQIVQYLEEHHAKCKVLEKTLKELSEPLAVSKSCDLVIVLGGDGTILRTVRSLFHQDVPIMGVNLGTVGYLAECDPEEVKETLSHLLSNQAAIEKRMMLEGTMIQNDKIIHKDCALNDIAICRSGYSRIIRLRIYVNGEYMTDYDADGVVISTPTGSTAYNLSAGGPIVTPRADLIVVTPISPHSLSARSIILSGDDEITVEIERVRKTQNEEAQATFDGQKGIIMEPTDKIHIKKASESAKFVQVKKKSFYEIIRNKIGV